MSEDGVADAPLQAAPRFFVGLAFLDLAVVIGPALAVAETDLGDRGHVDGVVEPTVAPPRQPENLVASRGDLEGAVPL
jgi:hypothetical protein